MYADGIGVPKDLVHAYAWTMLAAAQGEQVAEHNMKIYRSEMTREQVAEAEELSQELAAKTPAIRRRSSSSGPGKTRWQQFNDAGIAAIRTGRLRRSR